MNFGLPASFAMHALIMGVAVVSLSTAKSLDAPDPVVIPIKFFSDVSRAVEGDTKAEEAEVPTVKPTEREETIPEAENIGDADTDKKADASKPKPEPVADKPETPAAAPEPTVPTPKPKEVKVEPKAKPAVEPKAEPKTDIAALVQENSEQEPEDKSEEKFETPEVVTKPKRRPEPPKEKPVKEKTEKKKPEEKVALLNKEETSAGGAKRSKKKAALGTKNGKAVKLSGSEMDALRAHIFSCWNAGALAGAASAETLRATAKFTVDKQGILNGKPDVTASGGNKRETRSFSGSVRRAITRCKEFPMLKDKYDNGEELLVRFSLIDMF